ncbi:MAG TPA: flagellar hook-basal body complex protein FliE [Verrucomicrobiae bacterium]|nr:flagellar hook-basal body complex protein FliE [Verrucomicrobiae bacterium]
MSVSNINAIIKPNGMIQFLPPAIQSLAVDAPISAPEFTQLSGTAGTGKAAGASFSDVLRKVIQDVDAKQVAATEAVNGVIGGQHVPLHQAMIAMEEANVSLQLMVEVRNRLLDSYQELMRMQV